MVSIPLVIVIFTLGVFVGYICRVLIVKKAGYGGIILITETEEKKIFSLELNGDPEDLVDRDEVIFKVSEHPSSKKHGV